MPRPFCLIALLLLLTGCCCSNARTLKSEVTEDFEVIGLRQPKHFAVSLRNCTTGDEYFNIYVSKHFNRWKEIPIGCKIPLTYRIYEDNNDGHESVRFYEREIHDSLLSIIDSE
jgi:hypothetical protein